MCQFSKGMLLGITAGVAGGIVLCGCIKRHRREFKRGIRRAMRNVNHAADCVNAMF